MNKKPIAYRVSCPRIPEGKVFNTLVEAKKEMNRQMVVLRSKHSGISEIFEQGCYEKHTHSIKGV